MRRGSAHPQQASTMCLGRLAGIPALVVGLIIGWLPLGTIPVAAAPPDPKSGAEQVLADAGDDTRRSSSMARYSADGRPGDDRSGNDRAPGYSANSAGSVRYRGLEAPVVLRQAAADEPAKAEDKPAAKADAKQEKVDPGDGPVPKRDNKSDKAAKDQRRESSVRLWPLPEKSYTFTQRFGCTQQLGNLYFPGDGCPAHAPVVHTGVDLAAPEGTVFYAAASGWVTLADWDRPTPDANTRIIIQHDGRNADYATDYLHWIASYVEEGDYVRAGQPIGEVGSVGYSTGPHLHFSVTDLRSGEHVDPVRWLPRQSGSHDYTGRRPGAKMRLPAGTTAGQPESADPEPPKPAKREKVPDSPPSDSGGDGSKGKAGKNGKNGKHDRAKKDAKTPAEKTDQPSSGKDESADTSSSTAKDRKRTRERNKDGQNEESSSTGEEPPPPEEEQPPPDEAPEKTGKSKGGKDNSGSNKRKNDGSPDSGNGGGNGNGNGNDNSNNGKGDGGKGDKNGNGSGNDNKGGSGNGGNGHKNGGNGGGKNGDGDRGNGRVAGDAATVETTEEIPDSSGEESTTIDDEIVPTEAGDEVVPA